MAFKKRYIALPLLTALGVCISQFPASWAVKLAGAGVPVTLGGTVWKGFVPSLRALPPITFDTAPMGLFTKAPLVAFNGRGNGISIEGKAERSSLTALKIAGDASFLGEIDGRMSNLMGQFNVNVDTLRFDKDCSGVSGRITTDILARNAALWRWTGPALSGPIECIGGVLTSTLSGNVPGQSVEAVLKIMPSGTFQIRAVINTNTPEAALVLPLYGFEGQGERFTMNESGRWM